MHDRFDFEYAGLSFRCIADLDSDQSTPWNETEGHGPIRYEHSSYGRPTKRAGEAILYSEGRDYWIYDVQASVKEARRDGWSSENCTAGMTEGQRAAQAVADDMRYCRDWLRGDRYYLCLEVFRIGKDGERIGESEYLGGVESGYDKASEEYARECAEEMARNLILQPVA